MRLLLRSAALALFLLAGCKQGVGDRCQIDSDCDTGLVCSTAGAFPTCREPVAGGGFPDASPPPDARRADAPAAEIDAAPPAVDAGSSD